MKLLNAMALAGIIGAGLTLTATSASARIICNEEGDCWHSKTEYVYPPSVRLMVHPDDWKWKEGERFSWREHEGRGFWRGGRWEGF
ncbi:MAG: hypothetical protein JO163_11215 [Methylobacteriaceae bacterium]|nr:hypothetical protein [Methylobacteriaceae bacterium]MBV9703289.1 hypothetical protein [Methylobacteriaceae bacterium]